MAAAIRQLAKARAQFVAASRLSTRAASTYSLPDLDYDYGALEPYISGEIMQLHHAKHHAAYVNNFNASLEKLQAAEAAGDASSIVNLQAALKFNGGGHINHSIFWKNLSPPSVAGGHPPEGALASAIESQFGSHDAFVSRFNGAGAGLQGSGWVWLGVHPELKNLAIVTTPNQDPCSTTGFVPLLGVDVWEHAYYLQYKNVRPDYLKSIWKIVNWKDVSARYAAVAE